MENIMSVVEALNKHLALELGAHIRYSGHAEIIAYRGYGKLADIYRKESGEELAHANKIIRRIQQLDGFPRYLMTNHDAPVERWDIEAILGGDLETEKEVLDSLASLIETAEQENDWETGNVLRALVTDTEDHVTWLTQQVQQIVELGKENYLQAQL
jgi:bacterioferritin